jgi:hypothetical protein
MAGMGQERQQSVRAVVRVEAVAASNAVAGVVEMYAQALGEAQRTITGLEQALEGALAAANSTQSDALVKALAKEVQAILTRIETTDTSNWDHQTHETYVDTIATDLRAILP